ncbi:MAG: phosphoribosylaminoimidazole synthetase [Campylobacterota bacterium]
MHSHRLQRLLTGTMLSFIWALFYLGESTVAFSLLAFVVAMIFIWAIFDFCPSLWFFQKVLKEENAKPCC